jgi:hypothetical protein
MDLIGRAQQMQVGLAGRRVHGRKMLRDLEEALVTRNVLERETGHLQGWGAGTGGSTGKRGSERAAG